LKKIGGISRELPSFSQELLRSPLTVFVGGKAKPLKAAKKEKELNENNLAFKDKQRASTVI
jgi:hypothetical protein